MTSAALSATQWTEINVQDNQGLFSHELMSDGGLQILYSLKCTCWHKHFWEPCREKLQNVNDASGFAENT